jgi:hypothetical protein
MPRPRPVLVAGVEIGSPGDLPMIRKLFAALVVSVAALGGVAVAADLKSGPQVGEDVPGPFHPLNVNGEDAGKKACLYCKAGDSPVVAVFARSADSAALKKLITTIEEVAAKNPKAELNSFVVFCSNNDKLEGELKDFAEQAKLRNVVLAIEEPAGPEKYNISRDAEVTVILYKERVVKANHSFAKGKLTEKDIEAVSAEIGKLVK